MKVADLYPPSGHVQRMYCDNCQQHLALTYTDFQADVSGIDVSIAGLPVLRCDPCKRDHLPDRSRLALIETHKQASEKGAPAVKVTRRKPNTNFGFTSIPFVYDSDDYDYIPGLMRPHNSGFLTPVFFNRVVLLKYDTHPDYRVRFASATYGDIVADAFDLPFGINRSGKVVMWLGDIAKLPDAEQYYLLSENVPSDHDIGSEFYDGQIECIFTEPPPEGRLFGSRSQFVDAAFQKFGRRIAHLDQVVMDLALGFNAPVIDSEKERRHVADTLNKIYIESFDNTALAEILRQAGGDPKSLGSLKLLQAILETLATGANVPKLLSPFYVLYDLRVAYSHLTSAAKAEKTLKSVTDRLNMTAGSGLLDIYRQLTADLASSFEKLMELVQGA